METITSIATREIKGHLTTADRRNIKAISAHEGTVYGTEYQTKVGNHRRWYTIHQPDANGVAEIEVGSLIVDDFRPHLTIRKTHYVTVTVK